MSNINIIPDIKIIDGKEYVSKTLYDDLKLALDADREDSRQLRKNKAITDAEIADISRIRSEHKELSDELSEITMFVNEHYAKEIKLGQHKNFRTIVDVVMFYLGKERVQEGRAHDS